MLTREDWDFYAGAPNEFFAAPGDRILHEEIPEQAEEFWNDFLNGKGGRGFNRLDRNDVNGVNRTVLIEAYRQRHPDDVIVRSRLNEFWNKCLLTATDLGFTDFESEPEVEEVIDPREADAARIAEFEAWSNAPDTSVKMINERKRTDRGYREYYDARLQQEVRSDDPMAQLNAQLNSRQPLPSTTTATSRKVAPAEVRQFAVDFMRMPTAQLKTLLSPATNPNGPADAARVKRLFDDACAFGLI